MLLVFLRVCAKFLAFTVGKELFFWKALPFGLAVALLVFTKLMKFLMLKLREQGVSLLAYLDDWILWALWSISEAIQSLKTESFCTKISKDRKCYYKALFLTALASGSRVSELAALDRAEILISPSKMVLPVRQGFIYKKKSLTKCPEAISFPSFREETRLCPVIALNNYLQSTRSKNHCNHVFLSPISDKPLNAARLGFWLAKIISELIPDSKPRAHDVRKIAFSLAWSKGITMKNIVEQGFWSSSDTFIKKYLMSTRSKEACVTGQFLLT